MEYCQDEYEWEYSTEESEYTDDGNVDEDAKCAAFYNLLESFLNDLDYEDRRDFFENTMNIQIDLTSRYYNYYTKKAIYSVIC